MLMLEFFVGLSLTLLCLYALVDKLHKSDKDLHINKKGIEVCSAKQDSKPKWVLQGLTPLASFLYLSILYNNSFENSIVLT